MKLSIIDRKEIYEYPEDFIDYSHRYALHVITEEYENGLVCGYDIGYCENREDYDKIIEIVNDIASKDKEQLIRECLMLTCFLENININEIDRITKLLNSLNNYTINKLEEYYIINLSIADCRIDRMMNYK